MTRSRVVPWVPVWLWAAIIFGLSAMSNPPAPGPTFPFRDKLAHTGLYAVLGWLTVRALRRAHNVPLPKACLLAIVLAAAYGATDEWHQHFVPYRTSDLHDWIADAVGATLAATVYYVYESHRRAKPNR